jgi:hypothetical protein
MATRSKAVVQVVSSAATWMPGCWRRRCRAQALSLPLLHDKRTLFKPGSLWLEHDAMVIEAKREAAAERR